LFVLTRADQKAWSLRMINRRRALGFLALTGIIPSRVFAQAALPRIEIRDSLAKRFAEDGTVGVFAAYDSGSNSIVTSDAPRSKQAILPASTFKIPNSIIALETGVVTDPDKDVFKWDGVARNFPDWNRDHTLRTAIAASAVPVYQEVARRIGADRMKTFVDKLDYGNRDIGGAPIDYFWLTGNLRVSALQQIGFLDRLRRGVLPISKRSQDLTRDILPVTKVGDSVIRAKSGLIGVDDKSPAGGVSATVGWLVGWVEKGSTQTVFGLNLDIREPRHIASRVKLTQQLLADVGAS
jgi:beta-lactamase class D